MSVTQKEIISLYDLMSVQEVAMLIGLGATLPHQTFHRHSRMMAATEWLQRSADEAGVRLDEVEEIRESRKAG